MATKKVYTLVFPRRGELILLGQKARGFGKSLWNGFGGKVEKNETIQEAAIRELKEECNLISDRLNHLGVVRYESEVETGVVHIFTCSSFKNTEKASEEMNPINWFGIDRIPYGQMWPDANKWFQFMLNEDFFSAHVFYAHGQIQNAKVTQHAERKNALLLAT